MPRALIAALAIPVAITGCATTRESPYAPHAVDAFALSPYAIHEECRHLETGDRLDYRFESSEPVAFDLRYREGNAVLMPIVRRDARSGAGVYPAPFAEDFCLSWEAGAAGATLSYHFQVHPAP